MATTFTISNPSVFPNGTSVGAYPATNWGDGRALSGAPLGAATNSQTMTAGTLTFTGLTDQTTYYAVGDVGGGNYRYVRFKVGADVSTQQAALDLKQDASTAATDPELSAATAALVTGPASAVSGNLPTFNGATGKIIQDSGVAISIDGTFASNSDAKNPTEKATKSYADLKAAKASNLSDLANAATARTNLGLGAGAVLDGSYIYVRDQKAANTDGGASTGASWNTRVLNTEVSDTGNFCTLASNQITLTAGTYRFKARAPCLAGDLHKLRLRNVTDGTTVMAGSNAFASSASSALTDSACSGKFTIAASKALELQHYITTGLAGSGFGAKLNAGEVEVYAEIEFWKD